ncbi:MAG: TM2 domain-containing protein [Bacteroidales bacterium]|nr:TM2 domain-containing protein [Bacteroidales bacterium]
MNADLVQNFMLKNAECFDPTRISIVQKTLEELDDSKAFMMMSIDFQKPTLILVIAILLGWDRFFLGDIGLGILKVITCYGCWVWWLIDIFTAQSRTYDYNFKKFTQTATLCK